MIRISIYDSEAFYKALADGYTVWERDGLYIWLKKISDIEV